MRLKFQIAFDILLITASCIILVYNFSVQRRIAYFASIGCVRLNCVPDQGYHEIKKKQIDEIA